MKPPLHQDDGEEPEEDDDDVPMVPVVGARWSTNQRRKKGRGVICRFNNNSLLGGISVRRGLGRPWAVFMLLVSMTPGISRAADITWPEAVG